MFPLPFRWSLAERSALGGLALGERAPTYEGFGDDLLGCCSRVLAGGGDSDLVFVGRSPESVFDHLSGLLLNLLNTSWGERLSLLQFSMRFTTPQEIARPFHIWPHPQALRLALDLFESGAHREQRLAFAALLAREPAMRHEWFRALAHEIKAGSKADFR